MKDSTYQRSTERGSASTKFMLVLVLIVLLANAGYQYIPVAYQGASFRQEMDTAVVKGLAASGRLKPFDVVKAHVERAALDNEVPPEAFIEITPMGNHIQARAVYTKKIDILPFGIFQYDYNFDYSAAPQGYLTKE